MFNFNINQKSGTNFLQPAGTKSSVNTADVHKGINSFLTMISNSLMLNNNAAAVKSFPKTVQGAENLNKNSLNITNSKSTDKSQKTLSLQFLLSTDVGKNAGIDEKSVNNPKQTLQPEKNNKATNSKNADGNTVANPSIKAHKVYQVSHENVASLKTAERLLNILVPDLKAGAKSDLNKSVKSSPDSEIPAENNQPIIENFKSFLNLVAKTADSKGAENIVYRKFTNVKPEQKVAAFQILKKIEEMQTENAAADTITVFNSKRQPLKVNIKKDNDNITISAANGVKSDISKILPFIKHLIRNGLENTDNLKNTQVLSEIADERLQKKSNSQQGSEIKNQNSGSIFTVKNDAVSKKRNIQSGSFKQDDNLFKPAGNKPDVKDQINIKDTRDHFIDTALKNDIKPAGTVSPVKNIQQSKTAANEIEIKAALFNTPADASKVQKNNQEPLQVNRNNPGNPFFNIDRQVKIKAVFVERIENFETQRVASAHNKISANTPVTESKQFKIEETAFLLQKPVKSTKSENSQIPAERLNREKIVNEKIQIPAQKRQDLHINHAKVPAPENTNARLEKVQVETVDRFSGSDFKRENVTQKSDVQPQLSAKTDPAEFQVKGEASHVSDLKSITKNNAFQKASTQDMPNTSSENVSNNDHKTDLKSQETIKVNSDHKQTEPDIKQSKVFVKEHGETIKTTLKNNENVIHPLTDKSQNNGSVKNEAVEHSRIANNPEVNTIASKQNNNPGNGDNSGNADNKQNKPFAKIEFPSNSDQNNKVNPSEMFNHTLESVKAANPVIPKNMPLLKELPAIIQRYYDNQNQAFTQSKVVVDGGEVGKLDIRFHETSATRSIMILVENESARAEMQRLVPMINEGLNSRGVPVSAINIDIGNSNTKNEKRNNSKHNPQGHGLAENMEGNHEQNTTLNNKRYYGYNSMDIVA